MIAWPTRADGSNLRIAEMTPNQSAALIADAKARTCPVMQADDRAERDRRAA